MKTLIIIDYNAKEPTFLNDEKSCFDLLNKKLRSIDSIEERLKNAKSIKAKGDFEVLEKQIIVSEILGELVNTESMINRIKRHLNGFNVDWDQMIQKAQKNRDN